MGETVSLTTADGHTLDAYKAEPSGESKGGLVVIQEIFGVNSQIRSTVDYFASQGRPADVRICSLDAFDPKLLYAEGNTVDLQALVRAFPFRTPSEPLPLPSLVAQAVVA